jgi:N-acetylneuraminate lyase
MYPKTDGLIAAPFSPLRASGALASSAVAPGTVDLDVIPAYADWLRANQVIGAFICGTTGEGMSLSVAERQQLAERWMQAAGQDLRVIVHVGHNSLADCQTLAAHAQQIGAHSFACMAPFFFKPAGVEGLVEWCAAVAAAAPKLPFYYYHMPSMTGVSLPVSQFLEQAGSRIPNLVGVKYTHDDLQDFERCLHVDGGRFDLLFGRDELLHSVLKLGARGAVGSTYNFAAPVYRAVMEAFAAGDETRAAQRQQVAVRMIDALVQAGPQPIATFKWFMQHVGVDCGPPRQPLRPLTPEQAQSLQLRLEETGIYDWIGRTRDDHPGGKLS